MRLAGRRMSYGRLVGVGYGCACKCRGRVCASIVVGVDGVVVVAEGMSFWYSFRDRRACIRCSELERAVRRRCGFKTLSRGALPVRFLVRIKKVLFACECLLHRA